ncbi:unnamed protein product [Rhizoctonia solani]|uniref:Protein kinase domain-containing protein n=1 Tax=Rhizoctonia solani TaxID=456999 RepID=A0A8H3HCK8_9AGAM|nr:unnamed protein product [Rhizoctonia solani]CAE6503501.1 unnamed protein product [Rhizoctonia solani]
MSLKVGEDIAMLSPDEIVRARYHSFQSGIGPHLTGKYILVFCDGTGKDGKQSSTDSKTNVWKLYQLALSTGVNSQAEWGPIKPSTLRQREIMYLPGVGSGSNRNPYNLLVRLFGSTIVDNIVEVYLHIAKHYEAGSQVYLFGYSRGAFITRKVASLIYRIGIIRKREEVLKLWDRHEQSVPWNFIESPPRGSAIRIQALVVWDTVGLIRSVEPKSKMEADILGMSDEELPPNVNHAFHVVAFHENRKLFRVTLFQPNPESETKLKEVWFPGSHSDVGGGDTKRVGLSDISLIWIIGELQNACALPIAHDKLDYPTDIQKLSPSDAYHESPKWKRVVDKCETRLRLLSRSSLVHETVFYLKSSMPAQLDPRPKDKPQMLTIHDLGAIQWDIKASLVMRSAFETLKHANAMAQQKRKEQAASYRSRVNSQYAPDTPRSSVPSLSLARHDTHSGGFMAFRALSIGSRDSLEPEQSNSRPKETSRSANIHSEGIQQKHIKLECIPQSHQSSGIGRDLFNVNTLPFPALPTINTHYHAETHVIGRSRSIDTAYIARQGLTGTFHVPRRRAYSEGISSLEFQAAAHRFQRSLGLDYLKMKSHSKTHKVHLDEIRWLPSILATKRTNTFTSLLYQANADVISLLPPSMHTQTSVRPESIVSFYTPRSSIHQNGTDERILNETTMLGLPGAKESKGTDNAAVMPMQLGLSRPSDSVGTISSTMSVSDILAILSNHGCNNATEQLDLSGSSQYPILHGGFGDLYSGTLKTGDRVAIKCLRGLRDGGEQCLKQAAHELYIWSKCNHPHIMELIGVAHYRNQIAMISPWMKNGHMREFLSLNPNVDTRVLSVQIADGVAYLHGEGIVHGDIKGQNVLIDHHHRAKLADFGTALLKHDASLKFTSQAHTLGLSLRWAAPELFKEDSKQLSRKSDVYALGMTILEAITGSEPYAGVQNLGVLLMVTQTKLHPPRPRAIPQGDDCANRLWLLLTNCWAYEPQDRPEAIDVFNKMKDCTTEYYNAPIINT